MELNRAVAICLKIFPGAHLAPLLFPSGSGIGACTKCGGSTALVDRHGKPWHHQCIGEAVATAARK